MFKRLLLVSALCISLMALLAAEARTWPLPKLPSGWPVVSGGSLILIQQVQRVHCEVTEAGDTICVGIAVGLKPTQVLLRWCNPGGQCDEYRGIPFELQGPIYMEYCDFEEGDITKKGLAYYQHEWTTQELFDALKDLNLLPPCDDEDYGAPNCNWELDENYLVVNQVEVLVQVYGTDQEGNWVLGDQSLTCHTRPVSGVVYIRADGACPAPPE